MSSLLALSATHLAWITKCPITNNCAYQHRGIALKGLQEAIGNFSRENSDAVLAASILLSWQAGEWLVSPLWSVTEESNLYLLTCKFPGEDGHLSCREPHR